MCLWIGLCANDMSRLLEMVESIYINIHKGHGGHYIIYIYISGQRDGMGMAVDVQGVLFQVYIYIYIY